MLTPTPTLACLSRPRGRFQRSSTCIVYRNRCRLAGNGASLPSLPSPPRCPRLETCEAASPDILRRSYLRPNPHFIRQQVDQVLIRVAEDQSYANDSPCLSFPVFNPNDDTVVTTSLHCKFLSKLQCFPHNATKCCGKLGGSPAASITLKHGSLHMYGLLPSSSRHY